MTLWRVLAYKYIFEYIFSVTKLAQVIDTVMSDVFQKDFAWFGGLGPKSKPFLIYQPTTINQKNNYNDFVGFYSFEVVH